MTAKKENPINLSQKARRNLYLRNRAQIEKDKPELLPDFDRLHGLNHQEFPRLHEFRMGWICGRSYEQEFPLLSESTLSKEETITLSLDVYQAWVDSVLAASAAISTLEDRVRQISEESGVLADECKTLQAYIEETRLTGDN